MARSSSIIIDLRISYQRAVRCWKSNDLLTCLQICANLSGRLDVRNQLEDQSASDFVQLRQLVWFLKLRCLSEDSHVNESLLLNENDLVSDNQRQTFTATCQSTAHSTFNRNNTATGTCNVGLPRRPMTGKVESRKQKTAILTGRMPSALSRPSGRTTTAHRPLTTSLTATQTAFSRSTRPLLKYATSRFLAKQLYEYLYSVQNVASRCPDYRQCLEYINLVRAHHKKFESRNKARSADLDANLLISMGENTEFEEQKRMGYYWLLSQGICYFHLNMNKQAGEYFRLALAANPKYLDSYTWLTKVYLRLHQPDEVLKTCKLGLSNSENTILFNWLARVQSLQLDSFAANQSLRDSLKFDPTNIEALANVGYFSFYGDRVEQSLKCFERIIQLSLNKSYSSGAFDELNIDSSAELLNNLALSNLYCGHYDKVMPLFQRAFLSSPNKETTSCIWYNISFVPLSCGATSLAIACLKLALINDSQNEEALNNYGALKYGEFINDNTHFINKQELWLNSSSRVRSSTGIELKNLNDQRQQHVLFNEVETYFKPVAAKQHVDNEVESEKEAIRSFARPEMLFNMALVERKRGNFLKAVEYLESYLEQDLNNYVALKLLDEIRELVSFDS